MFKSDSTPTEVILTRKYNFGIVADVTNVKFNKKQKCFTFDVKIKDNPYMIKIQKGLVQEEVFQLILDSLSNDIYKKD